MIRALLELIFPSKCVFCCRILPKNMTEICTDCRKKLPFIEQQTRHVPYSQKSIAVFYYEDTVREAILRYKFMGKRHYCAAFGRLLAMKIAANELNVDVMTYVPVSRRRKRNRGYDQARLLCRYAAQELGMEQTQLLKKIRNNPAQSGISTPEKRRANVLGVYRAVNPELIQGKNILLIDDVLTTGATMSECCRTLLDAGAAQVSCAALACARYDKNSR